MSALCQTMFIKYLKRRRKIKFFSPETIKFDKEYIKPKFFEVKIAKIKFSYYLIKYRLHI